MCLAVPGWRREPGYRRTPTRWQPLRERSSSLLGRAALQAARCTNRDRSGKPGSKSPGPAWHPKPSGVPPNRRRLGLEASDVRWGGRPPSHEEVTCHPGSRGRHSPPHADCHRLPSPAFFWRAPEPRHRRSKRLRNLLLPSQWPVLGWRAAAPGHVRTPLRSTGQAAHQNNTNGFLTANGFSNHLGAAVGARPADSHPSIPS